MASPRGAVRSSCWRSWMNSAKRWTSGDMVCAPGFYVVASCRLPVCRIHFGNRQLGTGNLQPQLPDGRLLVFVDRSVIRQSHDLKSLVDDGRQAAEGDLAAFVHHLLDDLDEDADADRVDDLGLAQVEQEL